MNDSQKIEELLHHFRVDKRGFAEKCGLESSIFSHIKAGKCKISKRVFDKIISAFPEINMKWLATGEGEMIKKEDTEQDRAVKVSEHSIEGIPLLPIDAMAGLGKGEFQIMEYECERYVVPMFKGAEFLIQVKGSSMIPKYNSGDVVACKRLVLNDLFFQWNKVYVLDTSQGALVKRIKKGRDDDHILIVSDNEQYEPFELHKNQIYGVALVIGVIRLE
jgi:phage repressor protein C with HTH and peptisase S24 domain